MALKCRKQSEAIAPVSHVFLGFTTTAQNTRTVCCYLWGLPINSLIFQAKQCISHSTVLCPAKTKQKIAAVVRGCRHFLENKTETNLATQKNCLALNIPTGRKQRAMGLRESALRRLKEGNSRFLHRIYILHQRTARLMTRGRLWLHLRKWYMRAKRVTCVKAALWIRPPSSGTPLVSLPVVIKCCNITVKTQYVVT